MVAFMMRIVISSPGIFAPLEFFALIARALKALVRSANWLVASFHGSDMTLTEPSGYTHWPAFLLSFWLPLLSLQFYAANWLYTYRQRKEHVTIHCRDTGTATTTPPSQINDLIGWIRKDNRAARAARIFVQFYDVLCQTTDLSSVFWLLCYFHLVKSMRGRGKNENTLFPFQRPPPHLLMLFRLLNTTEQKYVR